jgi:flagellar protein FliO/FliZ
VGDTDAGVSLIAELTDQETVDAMLLEDSQKGVEMANTSNFASLLRRAVGSTEQELGKPKAENVRKSRERLRKL